MEPFINLKFVVNAIVFSLLGIVVLTVSFVICDRLTPGNMWKEIVQEKNIALAILAGSFAMALAQIIASAIHG